MPSTLATVFVVVMVFVNQAQALIKFPNTNMYVDVYTGGDCENLGTFTSTGPQPKGCSKWLLLPARDVNNQCENLNTQFISRPKTLLTPKCDGVKEDHCFSVGAFTYVSCCAPIRNLGEVLFSEPSCPYTTNPTKLPTLEPTLKPSREPTLQPTKRLTAEPTEKPTKIATNEPTVKPTKEPSFEPTKRPTAEPTVKPTRGATGAPTFNPNCVPAAVGFAKSQCNKKIKQCGATSPMRWVGPSCTSGKYAGCQCQQYCNFTCKAKCTSSINKKFCKWENGQCKNKLTGQVGAPISQC